MANTLLMSLKASRRCVASNMKLPIEIETKFNELVERVYSNPKLDCDKIASELEENMKKYSLKPNIIKIEPVDESEKLFSSKISIRKGWGWHKAVIERGTVYDPYYGKPESYDTYIKKAFNQPHNNTSNLIINFF